MKKNLKKLFALLLVIVIPLSIVLVFFITSATMLVREDYLSLNRQSVSNICDTLDSSLNTQLNLAYTLGTNQHVKTLSNTALELSAPVLRQECQNISYFLRAAHAYDSIFLQTGVYFPDRELIVSLTNPRTEPQEFYNQHLELEGMDADTFFAISGEWHGEYWLERCAVSVNAGRIVSLTLHDGAGVYAGRYARQQ